MVPKASGNPKKLALDPTLNEPKNVENLYTKNSRCGHNIYTYKIYIRIYILSHIIYCEIVYWGKFVYNSKENAMGCYLNKHYSI